MSIKFSYDPRSAKQVIAEFSNGTPEDGSRFNCTVYQHENQADAKLKQRRKLVVKGGHLNYVGNNYKEREDYPYASKYVVAEINKVTGEARLFDADHYKLRPILVDDMSSDEDGREVISKKDNRSNMQKYDDLNEVFGSNRRKRSMAQRHRTLVGVGGEVVKKSLETLINDANFLSPNDHDDIQQTTRIIPCNRTAEKIEDVYVLDDLIPPNLLLTLAEEASQFLRPSKENIEEWTSMKDPKSSKFIIEHAKSPGIDIICNEGGVHTKYVCLLQMLCYLVKIFKSTQVQYTQPFYLGEVNEQMQLWLFESFYNNESGKDKHRRQPQRLKDKAISLGIIIAWKLDGYTTDTDRLRELFSVSSKKLSMLVRTLGGKIKKMVKDSNRIEKAVLAFPLDFLKFTSKFHGGHR